MMPTLPNLVVPTPQPANTSGGYVWSDLNGDLPSLPPWVPPVDRPGREALNNLRRPNRQTVAAVNGPVMVTYGRDRVEGAVYYATVVEQFLYVVYVIGEGPITYEKIFVDNLDVQLPLDGFVAKGGVVNYYLGTAGQTVDPLLSAVDPGWTETLPNIAYVVIKVPRGVVSGFPRLEVIIQGLSVYDPRKACLVNVSSTAHYVTRTNVNAFMPTTSMTVEALVRPALAADTSTNRYVFSCLTGSQGFSLDIGHTGNSAPRFRAYINGAYRTVQLSKVIAKDAATHIAATYQASTAKLTVYVNGYEAGSAIVPGTPGFAITYGSTATLNFGLGVVGRYQEGRLWNVVRSAEQIRENMRKHLIGTESGLVLYWRGDDASGTTLTDRTPNARHGTLQSGTTWADAFVGMTPSSSSLKSYSDNPSLALADMIYTRANRAVNWTSVIDAANANDVLVGPVGQQEKKRLIGLTLHKFATLESWLEVFRFYAAVFTVWEGTELRLVPDQRDVEAPGALSITAVADTWDSAATIGLGSSAFTFEARVRWRDAAASGATFAIPVGLRVGTTPYIYLGIQRSGGEDRYRVAWRDSGGNTQAVASPAGGGHVVLDEWAMLAAVFDGNFVRLYVNGAQVGVSAAGQTFQAAVSAFMRVSGSVSSTTNQFIGYVDEVRLWNVARTAQQIAETTDAELTGTEAGLVAYYRLNEGTGNTAQDSATVGPYPLTKTAGASVWAQGDTALSPLGVAAHFKHSNGDIVANSLRCSKRSAADQPTVVEIVYIDASTDNWVEASQFSEAGGVSTGTTPRRESVLQLPGIHRASQAKRETIERLNWSLSDLTVQFQAFDEALKLQIGAIIQVTHPVGLTNKFLRVAGLSKSLGRWNISATEYDPASYSDTVVASPTFPDTELGSPLNPPLVSNLTIVEELFQVRTGVFSTRIRATWDDPQYSFLYQYVVEGYVGGVRVFQTTTMTPVAVTPAVEELVALEPVNYIVKVYVQSPFAIGAAAQAELLVQGKLAPPSDVPSLNASRTGPQQVTLSWANAVDLDIWRYEVRYGTVSDNWETATRYDLVDGLTAKIDVPSLGTWVFFVKAVDSVGNYSENAISEQVVLELPGTVPNFTGFEVGGEVRLTWGTATGFIQYYEVAYGPTTEATAPVILDKVNALRFISKEVPQGTWRFHIKAADSFGNLSAVASKIDIVVTEDRDAFIATEYDFVTPGLTNMVAFTVYSESGVIRYHTTSNKVGSDTMFSAHASDPLANYHGSVSGQFLTETKDFGVPLTGNWVASFSYQVLNGTATVQLELSDNGTVWDVYPTLSAKRTARYARIRATTSGLNTILIVQPDVRVVVSVVPYEETGDATSVSSGPTTITLGKEYTAAKEVAAQAIGNEPLSAVVDNIQLGSPTTFDVYVFDIFGQQLAKPFKWNWKGI